MIGFDVDDYWEDTPAIASNNYTLSGGKKH